MTSKNNPQKSGSPEDSQQSLTQKPILFCNVCGDSAKHCFFNHYGEYEQACEGHFEPSMVGNTHDKNYSELLEDGSWFWHTKYKKTTKNRTEYVKPYPEASEPKAYDDVTTAYINPEDVF